MITVKAIKCSKCGDIVFSRTRHDYKSCTCGSISIDGGFDYIKVSFNTGHFGPEVFDYEVDTTKQDLYKDWNERKDKYGLVKEIEGGK